MKNIFKILIVLCILQYIMLSNAQSAVLCSGQVVLPNIPNGADVSPATIASLLGRLPKPYVAFTITEVTQWLNRYSTVTNPTSATVGARIVTIDANKNIRFKEYIKDKFGNLIWVDVSIGGTVDEFLIKINKLEKELTAIGYSVRDSQTDTTFSNVYMLYTDPLKVREQLINELKLKASVALMKCLDTILPKNCPQFDLNYTLKNLTAQVEKIKQLPDGTQVKVLENINSFDPQQAISVNGNEVTISDLITTVNVAAKVGCALGYNLFDSIPDFQVGSLPGVNYKIITWSFPIDIRIFASMLLKALNDKLASLSCPQFLCNLLSRINIPWGGGGASSNWWNIFENVNIGDLSTIKRFVEKIMNNILNGLSTKLDIPDITNMPVLDPPVYPNLELRKEKNWAGINEGNKGVAAVTSNAYYKLYGSETAQAAVAYGKFSAWIFNNEVNIVSASADFFTGVSTKANILGSSIPTTAQDTLLAYASVKLRYLGKSWGDTRIAGINNMNIEIGPSTPKQLFNFELVYTQRVMAGPVPIEVKMGAFFNSGIGWRAGIGPMKMYASVEPYASANAFIKAFAGISGFVGVGAGGTLQIIKANVPLRGGATLAFTPIGEPYLDLFIDSKLDVSTMSGSIYVWAEYIAPRAGIPPWKKKRKSKTLASYPGVTTSYPIFDWGMELGYRGLIMRGSLIDQQDLAMTAQLQATIDIYNRADALKIYLDKTNVRLVNFYGKLWADLLAETVDIPSSAQLVVTASNNFDVDMIGYKCKMSVILGQPCL